MRALFYRGQAVLGEDAGQDAEGLQRVDDRPRETRLLLALWWCHMKQPASLNRYQALLTAFHDPVFRDAVIAVSSDGTVVDHNPAAAAFFRGGRSLWGLPLVQLMPFLTVKDTLSGGRTHWHGQMTDAADRVVDVEVTRTDLIPDLAPFGTFYVIHNVSAYMELSRQREDLLYNVAHELRGPLTVLQGTMAILASEYESLSMEEAKGLLRSGLATTQRLTSLMENLLSIGSIKSGRFRVDPRPVDMGSVVDAALEAVEGILAIREQRVERQIPEALTAQADPQYIRQVLTNLLRNASKYSPEGSLIRVTAARTAGTARVAVQDQGPGIPPDQQQGIFERFYRTGPGGAEGVGLGLAMAKSIIEAHHGAIGVESPPGAGATVWFTLPLA